MDVYEALEILGLKRGCKKEDLKPAYRKLAMKFHPDKHGGSDKATEKMKKLNEAYDVCCKYEKKPQSTPRTGDKVQWVDISSTNFGDGTFKIQFDSTTFTIKVGM